MRFTEMFGQAKWMAASRPCQTPHFRRRFEVENLRRAELTICGLGFFEAYLNGVRITEDRFVPLDTNYFDRPMEVNGRPFPEKMETRILCPKYDVTALLRAGENLLCVSVGPGPYDYSHTTPYGPERLCFLLRTERADGSVTLLCSDEAVRWHESGVQLSNFTRGEEIDYTKEPEGWLKADYDDTDWEAAAESPVPPTRYEYMDSPADRVQQILRPTVIFEDGQKRVYDLGENISGCPLVDVPCPATVSLRFAEERTGEGLLDETSVDELYQMFLRFTTDAPRKGMSSRFTWFACRYIEVEKPGTLVGYEVIHSDVPRASAFECADENLNWLYDAYLRTQLSNMHMGIPSDCPHIERRGYTGDGQLTCEAAMTMLDAESFYRKWLGDISDCQDRISGHVQYTAPYVNSGGGPGGWGCAIVEVPYVFWKQYGDRRPLRAMYPQMLHYFDYLEAHSENGLVVSDEPDCWCLGDWCTAEEIALPAPYVNNYFYIKSISRVLEIAALLGIDDDRELLLERMGERETALIREYYDPSTGSFCSGIQGADAFAVDLGLGDERTFANLVSKYKALGMYDTGIFGTDILTRVLFERGEGELAFTLMAGNGKYSYANWKRLGSTTLWEYWTGDRSHDHPMFGAAARYLFQYILGIRQPDGAVGFEQVVVSPARISGLEHARGSQAVKGGKLSVDWERRGGDIRFTVELEGKPTASLVWNGRQYPLRTGRTEYVLPF